MSPRFVKLSRMSARLILSALEDHEMNCQEVGGALILNTADLLAMKELRAALAPKPVKRHIKAARKTKAAKKLTKKEETKEIRAAVMERSGGKCECCLYPAGTAFLDLDHAFGRVRIKQSIQSCWALCRPCHEKKTLNQPSAKHWLEIFAEHARSKGYPGAFLRAHSLIEAEELKAQQAFSVGKAASNE